MLGDFFLFIFRSSFLFMPASFRKTAKVDLYTIGIDFTFPPITLFFSNFLNTLYRSFRNFHTANPARKIRMDRKKISSNIILLVLAILLSIHSPAQNAAADTIRQQLADLKPTAPHYLDTKIGMLGTLFLSIVHTDPKEAIKISDQLAVCLHEKGDSVKYYEALYRYKAIAYGSMGDFTNNIIALEAYAEALNRIGKSDGYAYVDIGNAYYSLGLDALAKDCYRQAGQIFEREKNVQGQCTVDNNFAQIYMQNSQYDSALVYLRSTLQMREAILKDKAIAGDSKLLMAACFQKLQANDSAIFYLRQVMNLLGSPVLQSHTDHVALQEEFSGAYNRMSAIYVSEKNWDSAAYYLHTGLHFFQIAGYTHRINSVFATWAQLYLDRKMYDSAWVNILRYDKRIAGGNNPDALSRLYKLYADYYNGKGNKEGYYKYMMSYYMLDDSLKMQSVNEGSLLASGTMMQLKNKSRIEAQNEELGKKNHLVAQQEKEKILLYAVSGLFLFIIAAGLFFFFQIRKKNKLIERYNQELQEANLTKEKFLSVISHDLRSPFNTLIGMSNVLVKNVKEKNLGQVMSNAEAINESSRKAYVLLDNLMQWVSLQKEKIDVHKESLPLNETVENVLLLFKNQALAQSVTVEKDLRTSTIYTDKNLLQVVLRNLLSNAIRHIPIGGIVKLCVEEKGKDIVIVVEDNGYGIEEETLKTLFVKKDHTNIARKGGGLGLLLVQEFVEQLGGSIHAENKPSGGAKFTIVLLQAAVESSKQVQEKVEQVQELTFTKEEKNAMASLIKNLERYEIFDTTELRSYLEAFDTTRSAAMTEWKKSVLQAIYHANNEQFRKLISLYNL